VSAAPDLLGTDSWLSSPTAAAGILLMADTLDRGISWLERRLGPPPGPPRCYFSGRWIQAATQPTGRAMGAGPIVSRTASARSLDAACANRDARALDPRLENHADVGAETGHCRRRWPTRRVGRPEDHGAFLPGTWPDCKVQHVRYCHLAPVWALVGPVAPRATNGCWRARQPLGAYEHSGCRRSDRG
jgi:hypothetical protein